MDPSLKAPTGKPVHANPVIQRRLEKARQQRSARQLGQAVTGGNAAQDSQAIVLAFLLVVIASAAALVLVHLNRNCHGNLASCPPIGKAR